MKNTYVLLTCVLIASASAVIALHLLSISHSQADNSFIRHFPPHAVIPGQTLDMGYNSYYFAGTSPEQIYFGNTTAPLHVVSSSLMLSDTHHIRLSLRDPVKSFVRPVVYVDDHDFYLLDGILPTILHGNTTQWEARRHFADTLFFTEAAPFNPASVAIRVAGGSPPEYILGKETRQEPGLTLAPQVLTKQIDGLFSVDGMMHYSRPLNTLVYLYYYRNEFICMDTSLNVRYRSRTIDTISHARIKVARVEQDRSITLASPPLYVNKRSCVSGNYLFVNSALKASNEPHEHFDLASVIDVYDLRDGTYRYSFYLANLGGEQLRDFGVAERTFIALHGQYVSTYDLTYQDHEP
jgi:hypothetical protein